MRGKFPPHPLYPNWRGCAATEPLVAAATISPVGDWGDGPRGKPSPGPSLWEGSKVMVPSPRPPPVEREGEETGRG